MIKTVPRDEYLIERTVGKTKDYYDGISGFSPLREAWRYDKEGADQVLAIITNDYPDLVIRHASVVYSIKITLEEEKQNATSKT
jgi:hypothetical protein